MCYMKRKLQWLGSAAATIAAKRKNPSQLWLIEFADGSGSRESSGKCSPLLSHAHRKRWIKIGCEAMHREM